MIPLVALAVLAHGPSLATIHAIAYADLTHSAVVDGVRRYNVPPEQRPYTRYLSMHAVPEEDRAGFLTALKFVLNGASIRGEFHLPRPIAGGRLLRLNLRELGWDRFSREVELEKLDKLGVKSLTFKSDRDKQFYIDLWETFGFSEPFFVADGQYGVPHRRGWIDPRIAAEARREALTEKLVISASWLLPRLLLEDADGGFYSRALILPPKEEDLYKRLGVSLQFADLDPRGKHGAAVIRSVVAYRPREIQFLASSTGYDQHYLTRTRDFNSGDRAEKDVRESPAGTSKHDASEILFSLMNGLQGGYLANGRGEQQTFAPQQVAEDQRESDPHIYHSPTKTVFNYGKCTDCHLENRSLLGFDDNTIRLIVPPRLDTGYVVLDKDPKKAALETVRIEEFYRSGLREKIELYRTSYENRVKSLTGMGSLEASRLMLRAYDAFTPAYASVLVTPEQAAREMAVAPEGARALWKASGENQLNFLAAGQPITRQRWEQTLGAGLRKDVYSWDRGAATPPYNGAKGP